MDSLIAIIFCLSFSFSFVFALGGIGSAAAIIPVLTWVGVPFNIARPTGLFINTLSMSGATYSNIKGKRLDFKTRTSRYWYLSYYGSDWRLERTFLSPPNIFSSLLFYFSSLLHACCFFLKEESTQQNTGKIIPL